MDTNLLWNIILTVVGILIGAIISVISYFLQRQKRSLVYSVKTNVAVVFVTDDMKNRVRVTFDNVEVSDVRLIELFILNNGNQPIKADDFERPLQFSFGEQAKVLGCEVITKEPANLAPSIVFTTLENLIIVEPLLLNRRDQFTIKILVTGYKTELVADTRIAGVSKVERKPFAAAISGVESAQKWVTYAVIGGLGLFLVFTLRTMILSVGYETELGRWFGFLFNIILGTGFTFVLVMLSLGFFVYIRAEGRP